MVEIVQNDMVHFQIRIQPCAEKILESYKTGVGSLSDVWVGGVSFIYTFHLGKVAKCFLEKVGEVLFCIPVSAQGSTSL